MEDIKKSNDIINEMEEKDIDYIVEHPEEFEKEVLEAAKKIVLDRLLERANKETEKENNEKKTVEITPQQIEERANAQTESEINREVEAIKESVINKSELEQAKEESEMGEK